LRAELESLIRPDGRQDAGRVVSIAPLRSQSAGYVSSLQHNFATLYGLPSFHGYDPLVAGSPANRSVWQRRKQDPLGTARAYGVRWVLEHRTARHPDFGPNPAFSTKERGAQDDLRLLGALSGPAVRRLTLPDLTLWELPGSRPLAFPVSAPSPVLPTGFDGAGARVAGPALASGGEIVLNLLLRPWLIAEGDGRRLVSREVDWGRVVVNVPAGTRTLALRYAPPWGLGALAGAALAALAAAVTVWLARRDIAPSQNWHNGGEARDDDCPTLVAV
jgi:hypothetical protein